MTGALNGIFRSTGLLPWLKRLVPPRPRLPVIVALVLCAAPASAQALADEGWALQGGPYLGSSIEGRDILPEFGARLGASRGTQMLDLTVSAYQVQFNLPRVRQWSFEALAGMAWQRRSIGLGFRSGIVRTPNFSGERSTAFIFGPHTAAALPLSPSFELRGEAGLHMYLSGLGPGGPRIYLRMGLEARDSFARAR